MSRRVYGTGQSVSPNCGQHARVQLTRIGQRDGRNIGQQSEDECTWSPHRPYSWPRTALVSSAKSRRHARSHPCRFIHYVGIHRRPCHGPIPNTRGATYTWRARQERCTISYLSITFSVLHREYFSLQNYALRSVEVSISPEPVDYNLLLCLTHFTFA